MMETNRAQCVYCDQLPPAPPASPAPTDPTVYQPAPQYQAPPPPYPPQPYQQQYLPPDYSVPAYAAPPQKTDSCAILSVVFSSLGVGFVCCFGWVFSLVGTVLGIVSLVRMNSEPQLQGRGLAWTGFILGLIPSLLMLGWLAFGLASRAR